MKNIFLSASLIIFSMAFSQHREITFEKGNVASVLAKAKKENKLIFVDAYTTWCGPCKWMAKNIFTNDTVADYFNKTFVNYTLDMEKGEGIEFAKKYQVGCYPTLLFINGDGNLVHRGAGGMPAQMFIEFAGNSLNDKSFSAQKSSIEKTGFNEDNITPYVDLLSSCCLNPSSVVKEYMKTVKEQDLLKEGNWALFKNYEDDPNSNANKYFVSNSSAFETKYGKADVEKKFLRLGNNYFNSFYQSKELDKPAYEKAKQEFTALNWPGAKAVLFETELNLNGRFDLPKYYATAASGFLEYHANDANSLNSMAWTFYENVTDKEQLKAACNMAKRACELQNYYPYLDTYAAVLYKAGDIKQAEIIANKAIEKAKADKMASNDYKETTTLLKKIKDNQLR